MPYITIRLDLYDSYYSAIKDTANSPKITDPYLVWEQESVGCNPL